MADTPVAGNQGTPSTASRNVGRTLAALLVLGVAAGFVLIANLILTFFSWKAAIALNLSVVGLGVLLWMARGFGPFWRHVLLAAIVVSVLPSILIFRTTWASHARHDARLAEMEKTVCAVELPDGATIHNCSGSLTNTGNGNSCRYLATAAVPSADEEDAVVSALEAQGFRETELDMWGDPIQDGRTYVVEPHQVSLFLQSSWQDDEGDLRCT